MCCCYETKKKHHDVIRKIEIKFKLLISLSFLRIIHVTSRIVLQHVYIVCICISNGLMLYISYMTSSNKYLIMSWLASTRDYFTRMIHNVSLDPPPKKIETSDIKKPKCTKRIRQTRKKTKIIVNWGMGKHYSICIL